MYRLISVYLDCLLFIFSFIVPSCIVFQIISYCLSISGASVYEVDRDVVIDYKEAIVS